MGQVLSESKEEEEENKRRGDFSNDYVFTNLKDGGIIHSVELLNWVREEHIC